jgi:hypothetical protein
MISLRFVIALLLSAAFIALECRATDVISSSSLSPHRRLSAAEGTFVRGMMAADHQFGLYMAVSETSRGGGTDHDENDGMAMAVSRRGGSGSGPVMHMHHVVDQARDAAVNLADVLRRRAFSPNKIRPKSR